MIEETGQVVAIDGDAVTVRAASRAGCRRCAEGRGCGGGVIGMLLADRLATVVARRGDLDLAVGDRVALAIRGAVLVRAAATVYLLPLFLMLFALLAAGIAWPAHDSASALAAAAGLGAGFVLARGLARRRSHGAWRPDVVRRLARERRCG